MRVDNVMKKLSYGVILLACLVLIGLADFFIADFNPEIFTTANFWFTILACALANYIMVTYTAIGRIDNALIKDKNVVEKKEELTKTVETNVETDFDDYLSVANRERKIRAWKKKISNKIAKLDEHSKDRDRETYWYGNEEEKNTNKYCIRRKSLAEKLEDEYINKNIAYLRVRYVKLRRYEVTHGCKQKYDDYKLTTKRNRKVMLDSLPRTMRSISLILVVSSFAFDYREFSVLTLIQFFIRLSTLCISIYTGLSYAENFISDTLIPDMQYRLNVIINYLTWKVKNKQKKEVDNNGK